MLKGLWFLHAPKEGLGSLGEWAIRWQLGQSGSKSLSASPSFIFCPPVSNSQIGWTRSSRWNLRYWWSHSTDLYFFNGAFYEFFFYSENLTSNLSQKMEGYLAHKWNLGNQLPSDHPYKNSAPWFSSFYTTTEVQAFYQLGQWRQEWKKEWMMKIKE